MPRFPGHTKFRSWRFHSSTTECSSGAVLRQAISAMGRGGFVSHQLTLEQALQGDEMFDLKQDDCRKVVLTPGSVGSPQPPNAAAR